MSNIYKKQKYFDLRICPAKVADSGWYSCYVVKKSWNDQNVKYYTYLNVIDEKNKNEDYQFYNSHSADEDEDLIFENCLNDSDKHATPADPTPVSLLNEVIVSEKTKQNSEESNKAFILTSSDSSSNEAVTESNNLVYDDDSKSKKIQLYRILKINEKYWFKF